MSYWKLLSYKRFDFWGDFFSLFFVIQSVIRSVIRSVIWSVVRSVIRSGPVRSRFCRRRPNPESAEYTSTWISVTTTCKSNWKQPSWLTLVVNKYFAVIQCAHAWQIKNLAGTNFVEILKGPNKFCQPVRPDPNSNLWIKTTVVLRNDKAGNLAICLSG